MTTISITDSSGTKARPTNILELLAQWRDAKPLEPEDQLPDIIDKPPGPVVDLK